MTLWPKSIFGRLVLGLVGVSLLAVGAAALYLYVRFHDTRSLFYEGTLQGFAAEIAKEVHAGRDGAVSADLKPALVRRIEQAGGRFIVLNGDGRRLAGTPLATDPFVPLDEVARYFRLPASPSHPELYGLAARLPGVAVPVYVQIAFPSGHVAFESVLHEFMKDIAWMWIPFLLLILLTNVVVVRIALGPLAQTVEEAKAIQPGGVAVPLTEAGLPDDILALVRTVNEAFIRLRRAYHAQEEFLADMAHELRTPLAVMKAQLATMSGAQSRLLERDVGTMERLIEQLLDRARLGRFRIEPGDVVDLRAVATEACAFLAPRIVERGRFVELIAGHEPVRVAGGHDDLFRAIRNLVENALEHTPPGSTITVEVEALPVPVVRVLDKGSGFPAPVLNDETRKRGLVRSERRDGVGLGLSIVERTMEAHGGALHLSNPAQGGGCALMRFPASAAEPVVAHA